MTLPIIPSSEKKKKSCRFDCQALLFRLFKSVAFIGECDRVNCVKKWQEQKKNEMKRKRELKRSDFPLIGFLDEIPHCYNFSDCLIVPIQKYGASIFSFMQIDPSEMKEIKVSRWELDVAEMSYHSDENNCRWRKNRWFSLILSVLHVSVIYCFLKIKEQKRERK